MTWTSAQLDCTICVPILPSFLRYICASSARNLHYFLGSCAFLWLASHQSGPFRTIFRCGNLGGTRTCPSQRICGVTAEEAEPRNRRGWRKFEVSLFCRNVMYRCPCGDWLPKAIQSMRQNTVFLAKIQNV